MNAKEQFLRNTAYSADLQAHREDAWLNVGFCFAVSQMALDGCSKDELAGARRLIETFQNLWEKNKSIPKLPVKTLDMDKPTREEPEPKK